MIGALEVILLATLTVAVSIAGYSVAERLGACLGERKAVSLELREIRAQLGSPQNAIYRLVATRHVEEPSQEAPRIPDRPNLA